MSGEHKKKTECKSFTVLYRRSRWPHKKNLYSLHCCYFFVPSEFYGLWYWPMLGPAFGTNIGLGFVFCFCILILQFFVPDIVSFVEVGVQYSVFMLLFVRPPMQWRTCFFFSIPDKFMSVFREWCLTHICFPNPTPTFLQIGFKGTKGILNSKIGIQICRVGFAGKSHHPPETLNDTLWNSK